MKILLIYGEVLIESKSNGEARVIESSLVLLACTVSSPTFCVVGLCLFKMSTFEW